MQQGTILFGLLCGIGIMSIVSQVEPFLVAIHQLLLTILGPI
jgi:hypothetical protein